MSDDIDSKEEQDEATEKDNVVSLHTKVEEVPPPSMDDIMEAQRGALKAGVIIGFNQDGNMIVHGNIGDMRHLVALLEMAKASVVRGLLGEPV